MPALENPQYEVFAIARARGALLEDAYEAAGYASGRGHAHRVANRPEVRERIEELKAQRREVEHGFPNFVVNVLSHLAHVNDLRNTTAGAREARASLVEALRIQRYMAADRLRHEEILMKSVSYVYGRPSAGRREAADRPPSDRHPTAIEPPSDRPVAALPPPVDSPVAGATAA